MVFTDEDVDDALGAKVNIPPSQDKIARLYLKDETYCHMVLYAWKNAGRTIELSEWDRVIQTYPLDEKNKLMRLKPWLFKKILYDPRRYWKSFVKPKGEIDRSIVELAIDVLKKGGSR